MLKQKKNLKFKFKKFKIENKTIKRLKKNFKHKTDYYLNSNFQNLKLAKNNQIKYQIIIRITPNNTFCTFKNKKTNKILLISSAGKYKLNISKKTLKFKHKIVIQNFLEEIQKNLNTDQYLLINFSGPIKIRKTIIKQLSLKLKNLKFIINVNPLKSFNGCRQKKKT